MTDVNKEELRRLANEATETEMEWPDAAVFGRVITEDWADYASAANPATDLALLDELESLERFKTAYLEWQKKTDWVQKDAKPKELGKHRADVLAARIADGETERDAALTELSACKESPGGCGYWREAARMRAAERDALRAEVEALRSERDGKAIVPIKPPLGLLTSMAIRSDHGLGVPGYYDQPFLLKMNHGVGHARRMECAIAEMRKLYEEVVGTGFYSADKEEGYAAMSKGERQDG